ncbi:MAG: site-specific integrase [Methylobacterium sp.]|nr:site-specific integrase [Methylobacterium sp.]
MVFGVAATRYWEEVGQFAKTKIDIARTIAWLQVEIGNRKLLSAIDGKAVAALVAKRRCSQGRSGKPVSPATVNRTTEVLRSIILRAERVWGERVAPVEWRKHRLREPQERVRELRADEEAVLFAALRPDYHPVVRFALLTGCRLAECVGLRWEHIDWGGRQIWIRGKGDKLAAIPLSPTLRELLWPLREQHPEVVFTYEVERGRRDRRKGERRPITYQGLKTVFTRQVKAALPDYRFHDNRHTAATRILRASGNLRVAQALLRHSSITTTTKYAHVMQDDVMAAMEMAAKIGSVTRITDQSPDQAFPTEPKAL